MSIISTRSWFQAFTLLALVPLTLVSFGWTGGSTGSLVAQEPPVTYKAPSEEPTPAETLQLEYINRCRANPSQDAALIAAWKGIPKKVDIRMFEDEMLLYSPAPPLVFDLALIKASRWHSAYQIKHGQGHFETPDKSGFSGESPSDRVRAAGLRMRMIAENVFLNANGPWYCHCGFVVDWGEGPGGMQIGRGHQKSILSPSWRLVGVGAIPHSKSKLAVTQEFASSNQRMVGGVVYKDRNQNRFYDINEGVGGIGLTVKDADVDSWTSGAYAMPIPSGANKINVRLDETTFVALLPDGNDNVKFDVFLSDWEDFAKIAKLLEIFKTIPAGERNENKRIAALTNLYFAAQDALIEESIFDEVIELTRDVAQQLDAAKDDVRLAMSDSDLKVTKKRINDYVTAYRRTAAQDWFVDAKNCLSIVESFQLLKKRKEDGKPPSSSMVEKKLRSLQRAFERLTAPEWKAYGLEMGK